MVKCPSCGADNQSHVKSWAMIGKPSKSGEMFKLTIGLYECQGCGKSFRCAEDKEKITMKGVLDRNNLLEEKLMEATKKRSELEERVQTLENEKVCLITEIEALRVIPALEEKASSLESDVKRLRGEKESLLMMVKELMADKSSTPVEKPLEAYMVEPVSDDQPPVVEASLPEQAAADVEAEAAPANDAEVVVAEVPSEATQAEVPVVEECPCGSIEAEPVVPLAEAEASPLAPTPAEESHAEVPLQEPELSSIVEQAPAEPVTVESSAKVTVVEVEPTQVPEAVAPIEDAVTETISTVAKPEEAPLSDVAVEGKAVDVPQVVAGVAEAPVIEVAPPEVKLEEATGVEHTPSEASTVTLTVSPVAEVAAGVVEPVEALVEAVSSVTQFSEKVEAQPAETPVAGGEPVILPTVEVVAVVSEVAPVADSNVVPAASVPAPVQEGVVSAPVIEVVPVVAASEVLVSGQVNVDAAQVVKLEQPILFEKSG
jgi:hypothetical protein